MYSDLRVLAQNTSSISDPYIKQLMAQAEKGDPNAQDVLGGLYIDGQQGVPQNYTEAVKWFRRAADQGLADAQFKLGVAYDRGQGAPQDYEEAIKWYRKAAEQGLAQAQDALGLSFTVGNGVLQDYEEAIKWYRKAAEQGYANSQAALGLKYYQHENYTEAAKWLRKAAEQGDVVGQDFLAYMYRFGQGVPQDYAEAVKWFRKAADQGKAHDQWMLGRAYQYGEGVPQDYIEAFKWYNLSASNDSPLVFSDRDALASHMTPEQIAEGQRRSSAFVPRKGSSSQGDQPVASFDKPRFSGSGFFISGDGYLLTNFHVIEDASKIVVQAKGKTFPARVVKADAANDIALLKVTGSFQLLPVATSRSTKLGDDVFTIGFPNVDVQGVEPKLTKGDISSLGGIQDDPRYFQVSLPIQPGNSGGPLVNQFGNVIGIVSAKLNDLAMLKATGSLPQNVGYALKASFMNAFLETIPELESKLRTPNVNLNRKFEEVVKEAQGAAALILVY
jgi:hypothetical protein